ncbi:MAG TPA: hypothetical protein VGQ36_08400 [Thermoanaerobaculia bacterium]|nr:hypothetical protein [Thermoanaerobaculia bacterium]
MPSLYGQDMLQFVGEYQAHTASAYAAALYLLTHGHRCPVELAIASLAPFDRAVFDTLGEHRDLPIAEASTDGVNTPLILYINSIGRLHIRNAADERVSYEPADRRIEIGYVNLPPHLVSRIAGSVAEAARLEEREFGNLRRALDAVHDSGALPEVIEQVIDHVQHVESVCFYVGDTLFALIERINNLIDSRNGSKGLLPRLRNVRYEEWSNEEILIMSALHALFLSGRSVRFEEFNGTALTATALWAKLRSLLQAYRDAGCVCDCAEDIDLFDLARLIRIQSLKSEGATWLRYRWIYGLTFQKTERILSSMTSTERPLAYLHEFAEDYEELVGPLSEEIGERRFFHKIAAAALDRDLRGVPYDKDNDTATNWTESWMEKVVASAIVATDSDYGMSSSLRDLSILVNRDEPLLLETIHALKPADFFTCFVSKGFELLEDGVGDTIADSVQRRMMFNRWHFIPGNLERVQIPGARHWYYPPVVPDIAIHSDVHRAGHERARVKYSVRAPGPDMSMPPLLIGGRPYRGFYDVRVVRMTGREYTTEEMLRTRRRTLWISEIYAVLADHLMTHPERRVPITGFQPGKYMDIELGPVYATRTRSISMELT